MDECIKKILIVNTGSDTFDYCQKSNLPADAGYVISALSATVGSIYHILFIDSGYKKVQITYACYNQYTGCHPGLPRDTKYARNTRHEI